MIRPEKPVGPGRSNDRDAVAPINALLTVAQVSAMLAASRDCVETLVRSGALVAVDISPRAGQPGHRPMLRICEADVLAFIAARRTAAAPAKSPKPRAARRSAVIDFVNDG